MQNPDNASLVKFSNLLRESYMTTWLEMRPFLNQYNPKPYFFQIQHQDHAIQSWQQWLTAAPTYQAKNSDNASLVKLSDLVRESYMTTWLEPRPFLNQFNPILFPDKTPARRCSVMAAMAQKAATTYHAKVQIMLH